MSDSRSGVPSILFVCTGNIFRSMVAEYALRAQLGETCHYRVMFEQVFRRRVPLFNHVAMRMETSILDLHEALPDWELDLERARAYVEGVVNYIWGATPALIARLPQFL